MRLPASGAQARAGWRENRRTLPNAHLHVEMSKLPRRHPGHGPRSLGDMSQNAPLSVPFQGNSLAMETQTSSLVTMEAATDGESVAAFVAEVLAGSGWEVDSIRHIVDRLDPPNSYWTVFAVDIYKDGEERTLRLV